MANTLKQQMTADAADGAVYFNTNEFADTITHYPQNDRGAGRTITVIDVSDQLEGTREIPGDGVVLETEFGERIHESKILELPVSVPITVHKQPQDTFLVGGQIWQAIRVIGKDADTQSVWVARTSKLLSRRDQRRG